MARSLRNRWYLGKRERGEESRMKILVINGSPKGKRSNSLRVTEAFLQGIQRKCGENGETVEMEQMEVCKMKIDSCKGCFACWKATPGTCCIHDDMPMIIEKLLWADLILYSFPLYYFNIPGAMKNLIDRQLPMVLPFMSERTDGVGSGSHEARYDMSAKKYVLISTCGFYSAKGNYDSVCRMFDHICGKDRYETIFCGQGELFSVKELAQRTDDYRSYAEQAGYEYAEGGIQSKTREKLDQLLYPKEIFEKMADASWGVSRDGGEKEDDSLVFTKQMAALYRKSSYDGKDRVLEICYTDLGKTYQIALTKDGSEVVTDGHLNYTTKIETPFSVWLAIAQNEIRGDEALAKQMYRVIGDFSLMINWDRFFGGTKAEENRENQKTFDGSQGIGSAATGGSSARNGEESAKQKKKPPVMTTMLLAWIVFWAAVSCDAGIGSLITLAVGAILPLVMYRYEFTIYDKLSIAATALLSVLVLTMNPASSAETVLAAGSNASALNPGTLAISLGYLVFGLMWLVSCLTKEPLCACYVKYSYGGDDALKNPIFMRANYILAGGWGILYLAIAVWNWFLSKTDFAPWLVVLNQAMPVIMGIFTGWFQNWYPRWVAGGRGKKYREKR